MKSQNRPPNTARREFLKTAFVGGASALGFPAIIPASALGANGRIAPSDRITVGCIGVGRMGGGHVRKFLRREDARVVAICDVQESARQRSKALVDKQYGDTSCA